MNIMNNNRFLKKTAWAALAVLALSSCKSDVWKDHYSVNGDVPTMTLAQTIESMPEYSTFVKALKSTYTFNERNMTNVTYWDLLNESNFMTVWLPDNASISPEDAAFYTKSIREKSKEDHKKVGTEFIGNHIARFSHTVGSATDERITMLSGKGYESKPESIAGTGYLSKGTNIRCSNGILHRLAAGKKVEFLPSIYEYITGNSKFADFGQWFKNYTKYEIDPEKSVEKGIVDGQMEYADSVMKMSSILLEKFGYINEEDSSFIVILPKQSVLDTQFDRIKDFFEYEKEHDPNDSLQKLYTYQAMMTDMFFNMSKSGNPHPDDSIVSTLFKIEERVSEAVPYHVYDPGILNNADSVVQCSNGKIYLYDSWPFQDKLTFLRPIKVEVENVMLTSDFTFRPRTLYRDCFGNPLQATVLEVDRTGFDNWEAPFYIPNTLKASYNLKIVMRRNTVTNRSYYLLPSVSLYPEFPDLSQTAAQLEKNAQAYKPSGLNPYKYYCGDKNNSNIKDPDVVESTKAFNLKNCNYGTNLDRCKVLLSCKATNKETQTSTVWIDCIILEPVGPVIE